MVIAISFPGAMEWLILLFVLAIIAVPIIAIVILWKNMKSNKMPL